MQGVFYGPRTAFVNREFTAVLEGVVVEPKQSFVMEMHWHYNPPI